MISAVKNLSTCDRLNAVCLISECFLGINQIILKKNLMTNMYIKIVSKHSLFGGSILWSVLGFFRSY